MHGAIKMYDIVIKGGTVVDPQGGLVTVANVAVREGVIVRVTREEIPPGESAEFIDATGKVVSPGFIDIHAHVDGYEYSARCMALQGVTTTIGGNCGISPFPVGAFLDAIDARGFPVNQGVFVGHSFTLREKVGAADRYIPATRDQMAEMCDLAEQALSEGALGISFGLEYAPGTSREEINCLARIAAKYGKPVAVHARADAWGGPGAFREAIRITEETGAPLQISHVAYMVGMGMMTEGLSVIDDAVERGLDVTADSGLYHAFATFVGSAVFDDWPQKYGVSFEGMTVATGSHAGARCDRHLFRRLREEEPEAVVVAFVGREDEIPEALSRPYMMVSSDGAVGSPKPGSGHPQDAGTFPKLFSRYVREEGRLTLLEAVKRVTVLPAKRLGLTGKGTIRPGADADIVVFDPKRIKDCSDYLGFGVPDAPPEGIEFVVVNGVLVVNRGRVVEDARPGRSLRRQTSVWEYLPNDSARPFQTRGFSPE